MSIQSRLKTERTARKLSQTGIASICGVTKQAVSKWESEVAIPADKLALLGEEGFDIYFILTGIRNPELGNIANETNSYDARIAKLSDTNRSVMDEMLRRFEEVERRDKIAKDFANEMIEELKKLEK